MRRKRQNRGLWFPTFGETWNSGDGQYTEACWENQDTPLQPADQYGAVSNLQVRPLTFDYTNNGPPAATTSLRDVVEGQDWLCQRIVGKFNAVYAYGNSDPSVDWIAVKVALGIFVARSKDLAEAQPDLDPEEMDPFAAANIQDSWMFRRTWILQNCASSYYTNPLGGPGNIQFPATIASYGSVLDGPHIDVKSKRRIDREHRLWAVVAVRGFGLGFTDTLEDPQVGSLHFHFDYRIHGVMRKGRNTSTF